MVKPPVLTRPGTRLIELLLEAFFNFSIALVPIAAPLDTLEGSTDMADP